MHRSRFLGHQPLLSRLVCRCHLLSSPQTPLKSLLAHARVAFSWPRVRLAPLTASSRRDVRPSLDRLLVSLDLGPRSPPPRAKNRISSSRRRQKDTARGARACVRLRSLFESHLLLHRAGLRSAATIKFTFSRRRGETSPGITTSGVGCWM